MSRTFAVIRREFIESVRTKMFLIGTIFGPILMIGIILVPALLIAGSETHREVVIVDGSDLRLGPQVAGALQAMGSARAAAQASDDAGGNGDEGLGSVRYSTRIEPASGRTLDLVRGEVEPRIAAGELDALLWIPPDVAAGGRVMYIGENVTNFGEQAQIRGVVQSAVQRRRMEVTGIDPAAVSQALSPIDFQVRKAGDAADSDLPEAMFLVAFLMAFAIYTVVLLYGMAVARGVMEEKRDRIVEIVVSSVRADQLMIGKVIGIGAAGLAQVLVWVLFAAFALAYGKDIAAALGGRMPSLPTVPASVGVVFVIFFAAGFFFYSAIYAALGSMATTDQELQQMQFPGMMPMLAAILLVQPVIMNPEGPIAFWGSMIPFTAPLIMPIRAYLTRVPTTELVGGTLAMIAACLLLLWVAARIYRIGILATGKRPSPREVLHWLRAG